MGQAVTYLSLKGISKIEKLPQSVGKIRDLKILDLKDCHNLQKMPQKSEPKIWEALCKEQYY
jgi:CHAD domain-containing protein